MNSIPANKAIDLYQALIAARRLQLHPALNEAVKAISVGPIDSELHAFVPADALTHIARLGLRGERVFPVPVIIDHAPPLIGYYRMLLGMSKKDFRNQLGYGAWINAEEAGKLGPKLKGQLEEFCNRMVEPLVELVYAIDVFTDRDLSDLVLLTLGPTLQGGRNTKIGKEAANKAFQVVKGLIDPTWVSFGTDTVVRFTTPAGDVYQLVAGSDPDLSIRRGSGAASAPVVAIEIKGGGDASNAHNRAGEAEKSQLKAKLQGYRERWTVIKMSNIDRATIASETPSSTDVFEFIEVIEQVEPDWERFRSKLLDLLGIQ